MSFFRRFNTIPTNEELDMIEGVNIAALGQDVRADGVPSGIAAVVGEFPDMSRAALVSSTGTVSSNYRPVYITDPNSMNNYLGSLDATLGEHGGSGGNGHIALYGKRWPGGFVAVPVNLAAGHAVRLWRDLPTNKSMTLASPVVPMKTATVPAGTTMMSGDVLVKTASKASFTAGDALASGLTAEMAVAASAATQVVTIAGEDVTAIATLGRILVCGVLGGAAANQGTFRIVSSALNSGDTDITVQKLDGSNYASVLASSQPWRIHEYTDADTAGVALSTTSGFTILARPLTNNTGGATAGTVATTHIMSAVSPAPDGDAYSWDALSGLRLKPHTSGLAFDPDIHAANAPVSAEIDAEYVAAMTSLRELRDPQQLFTVGPLCARTSATIRSAQRTTVLEKSKHATGAVCPFSPDLTDQTHEAAEAVVDLVRDEQMVFCWPGVQVYIPELVGTDITGADGLSYSDGYVDVPSDFLMGSIMAVLPPEQNPAQETDAVKLVTGRFGFQRGFPSGTDMNWYIRSKSLGICSPIWNANKAALFFQSGVTSSTENGKKSIARIRFNFFIDDTLAKAYAPYAKTNQTPEVENAAIGIADEFLSDLVSADDPTRSRAKSYKLDLSMNSDSTRERGYFFIGWTVKMYPSNDAIVGVSRVGFAVDTSE